MIKFENVSIQYVKDYFALYNFNMEITGNTLFVGDHYAGSNAITRLLTKIDNNYKGEIFINNTNLKNIKEFGKECFFDSDITKENYPELPDHCFQQPW